jgi:hypothetical protein
VGVDATAFAQNAADNAWTQAGAALRAASETDTYGWKKFDSTETATPPVMSVSYDRKPGAAAAPTVRYARTWNGAAYVATTSPFLSATASDPDGNTVRFTFEFRTDTSGSSASLAASCVSGYLASGATPTIPASTSNATVGAGWCRPSGLSDNTTYYVRAAVYDGYLWNGGWSPWTSYTVGATAPLAPGVSCPSPYADGSWQDTAPTSDVTCTMSLPSSTGHDGANAPVRALVSLDGGPEVAYETTPGPSASVPVKVPATPGGHALKVRSQTASSWASPVTSYSFGYGNGVTSPVNGATSNDGFKVTAAVKASAGSSAGTVSATLQWRVSGSSTAPWTDSTTATGLSPAFMGGGASVNNVTWRAGGELSGDAARTAQLMDVQVCFTFTAPSSSTVCTWNASAPVSVLRVPHAFGDGYPTADAGPGQVALFTGEFTMSATDVSVPGYTGDLSVSRSHATFNGRTDTVTGVFGPGWVANLDGADAGAAGMQVVDGTGSNGTISLVDADGSVLTFREPSKGRTALETGTYTPVGDDTLLDGSKLAVSTTGTGTSQTWTITFTEDDGTVTTFTRGAAGTSTATWAPASVAEAGVPGQVTYSRDSQGRVTRILAQAPSGVTCAATGALVAGCRALDITYAPATTATSTTPGDYIGQVQKIEMLIFEPDKTGGAGMTTMTVATDLYDDTGRLVQVSDPRSGLSTQYTYAGTNGSQTDPLRVDSVTPAGLKTVRLGYDTTSSPYKLSTLSRDDVAGGSTPSRLATFVYGIDPATTTSGLPDLTATTVAAWGQAKAPTKGFAVFGPDRTPAGTTPSTVSSADWPYADLQYTDALGYTVNTASYGAGAWQRTATDCNTDGNAAGTPAAWPPPSPTVNPPTPTPPPPATTATSPPRAGACSPRPAPW